jgi:hypothetical protein
MVGKRYAVDIPDSFNPEREWVNMAYFDTREEAIEYAMQTFGADAEGRVGLVTEIAGEEDG